MILVNRQYCAEPHTVEGVHVFSADGHSVVYPELPYRTETVSVDKINRGIGINETGEKIASLLTRMCLKSVAIDNGQSITVEVADLLMCSKGACFNACHSYSKIKHIANGW